MESNEVENQEIEAQEPETQEPEAQEPEAIIEIPEGYYENMQTAANFQSFATSIVMGLLIILIFFKGLR